MPGLPGAIPHHDTNSSRPPSHVPWWYGKPLQVNIIRVSCTPRECCAHPLSVVHPVRSKDTKMVTSSTGNCYKSLYRVCTSHLVSVVHDVRCKD